MYRIEKLKDHQYAQCKVKVYEDGRITLISYSTEVVRAIPHSRKLSSYELYCTGTYSRTTIRHISWFMDEYFGIASYYDMKDIAGTTVSHITRLTKPGIIGDMFTWGYE